MMLASDYDKYSGSEYKGSLAHICRRERLGSHRSASGRTGLTEQHGMNEARHFY